MHTSQAQPQLQPKTRQGQSAKRDGVAGDARAGLEGWLLALGGRARLLLVSWGLLVGLMVWLCVVLIALILDRWLPYAPAVWWLIDGVVILGLLAGVAVACVWVGRLRPSLVSAGQLASRRGVNGIVPVAAEYLASSSVEVAGGSPGLWEETVRRAAAAVQAVPAASLLPVKTVKRAAIWLLVCAVLSGGLVATGLRVPLKRMLNPGADFAPHTGLVFQITQSPDPAAIGQRVVVSVEVAWETEDDEVDAATLVIDDGQALQRVAMRRVVAAGQPAEGKQLAARFAVELGQVPSMGLPNGGASFGGRGYRVETALGRTDWQAWRVDRSPRLSRLVAAWRPPVYTGLAEGHQALSGGGRLRVPEGSVLGLSGAANRAIEGVVLDTPGGAGVVGKVDGAAFSVEAVALESGVWRVEAQAESLVGAMSINVAVVPDRVPKLDASFVATGRGSLLVSKAADDYGLSDEGGWTLVTMRDDAPVRVAAGSLEGADQLRLADWQTPLGEAVERSGLVAGELVWAEVWVTDNKTSEGQTTRVRTPPMVVQQNAAAGAVSEAAGLGAGGGEGEQSVGGSDAGASDPGGAGLSLASLSQAIDDALDAQVAGQVDQGEQGLETAQKGGQARSKGAGASSSTSDAPSQGPASGGENSEGPTGDTSGSQASGGGGGLLGQAAAAGFLSEAQAARLAEQWEALADTPPSEREAMREALIEQTREALADGQLRGPGAGDPSGQAPGGPLSGRVTRSGGAMLEVEDLADDQVVVAERGVLGLGAVTGDAQTLQAALEAVESGRSDVPAVYRKRVRAYLRALAEEASGSVDRRGE